MHRLVLVVLGCLTAAGQTRVDLRSQARGVDFSGANSTKPVKVGTSLPSQCETGEVFFKTDATPGANLYGCTAANTWSVQDGGLDRHCSYDPTDQTLKCTGPGGGTHAAVKTTTQGTPNQWVDYILPSGEPHTSQPTAAAVGAVADPGVNGIPYRSASGTARAASADDVSRALSCQDTGPVNTYACDLTPAVSAYVTGTSYWFRANTTNTGAATINFNHLGPRFVVKQSNQPLAAGDVRAGQWVMVTYDGAYMQMQSQTGNAGSGAIATVFGRSGAVTATAGDYTTGQVTESGNLYFTETRAQAAFSYPGVVKLNAGALDCPTCVTQATVADTDLSGSFPHLSVVKLQGRQVAATQPTDQQYLGWNNSAGKWEPKTLPATPIASIFGRTGTVAAQSGDYSFSQIAGTLAPTQLPATAVRTDQSNAMTAGTQDFSRADHTLPMKSGVTAALPGSCQTGETYFATDEPAGSNLYGCVSAGQWSVQGAAMTVASEGVAVGSRAKVNFIAGSGMLSLISDTGSEIDVLSALDTAVLQTQAGEQSGGALYCASVSQSATAFTCSLSPTLGEHSAGMVLHWQPDMNGAGGATTLDVDTLGATPVKLADGTSDPGAADIKAGRMHMLWHDGANFRLMQAAGNAEGAIADPGANGIVYRSGNGAAAPATADQMSGPSFCEDSGSGGAYACNLSPAITAYTTGTTYWFKAGGANSGPATIDFNGVGSAAIKKASGADLTANEIVAGQWVMLTFNGAHMQMLSQAAGTAGAGGVGSVFGRTGTVTAATGDYTTAQVSESGNLYFTVDRALAAVTWDALTGKPAAFTPAAHAQAHQAGGSDEIGVATPAANSIPRAGADGRLAGGWLPSPGASTLGGIRAADCSAVGFLQKINTDGSIACAAGSGGSGGTTRTWQYFWQGAVQAGGTGFAVNLPSSSAPSLSNSGGTRPAAVLRWPVGQSAYYAWWTFVLPSGYVTDAAIGYTLESRSADAAHAADVHLGLACSSNTVDNPTIAETVAVQITAAGAGARTTTTGMLTPNSGGLSSCGAGQRIWINLRVDTNAAGHAMTQPFDLISVQFSLQGGI